MTALGFQSNLPQGWNLISIGETKTPREFNDAVAPPQFNVELGGTPPNPGEVTVYVTTVWAWENSASAWYFYAPSLEKTGVKTYTDSKGYLDFATVGKKLGQRLGLWVNKP